MKRSSRAHDDLFFARTEIREAPRAAPRRAAPGGAFLAALLAATALGSASCSRGEADGERGRGLLFTVGSLGRDDGELRQPRALAVDPSGRFYVVDRTGRIQLFSPSGEFLRSWFLPAHELGQPVGVTVEREGTLLVNDSHYQKIRRYSPEGRELLESWGSQGTGPGEFTFGRDVVADSRGDIYAGDYGGLNDRIQKFSPEGEFILEWGGRGSAPGLFDRPQGMAIERRGDGEYLLVADCNNHRIQRFELDGRLHSLWGELGTEPGRLRHPISVAVAPDGMIWVCEWGNNRLQRFDFDGRPRGIWGGPGRGPGELQTPWDVEIGEDGRVFVADYGNHRVQVFRWEGERGPGPVSFRAREAKGTLDAGPMLRGAVSTSP